MKEIFLSNVRALFKFIENKLSESFNVIINPQNPFLLENANILVSSYNNSYLILYLTKEQTKDTYYLLYRIYTLKLAYPNEINVIIYVDEPYLKDYLANVNFDKFGYMGEIKFFNSKNDLTKYILKKKEKNNINREFNLMKNENFFRANLLFLKNYHHNMNTQVNTNIFDNIKNNIYTEHSQVNLYGKKIINYKYYVKESLVSIDMLSKRKNKFEYLKKMAYYSFLNNFVIDYDYLAFNTNKYLPNCIIFDELIDGINLKYLQNMLSFTNVFFTKIDDENQDFNKYYYDFSLRYSDRLTKFRKYNETRN